MKTRLVPAALWFFPALMTGLLCEATDAPMGVERVAAQYSPGYQSKATTNNEQIRWVQVDLGRTQKIDAIKLLPFRIWSGNSMGFPERFKIEIANDPEFRTAVLVTDRLQASCPAPVDDVVVFPAGGVAGRYVRLTATRLRQKQLALAKLEVMAAGRDVAEGCPVSDSEQGRLKSSTLTRPPRPMGEGVATDNPGNVIPAARWHPVAYQAQTPRSGVTLGEGLFKEAMANNIGYLLSSFTVDEMLQPFRERAGQPVQPLPPSLQTFWFVDLPGSAAGRFLMGAGNTLRWLEDVELRRRMNQIVDGIEECRRPDGYIMAYPEDTIFTSERAAYTRAWVTHGLIEAGYAGNPKAFNLLRGYYDWFDNCAYLPELLRRSKQGVQGMIANSRMYFTPVGKPEDLQVIQRYFQENYWLEQLTRCESQAIWLYPYDRPHCYLITALEPYLDLYRATGMRKYLAAAQGGWELYHDQWEQIGGTMAICEDHAQPYPPKSYSLHRTFAGHDHESGELCGSVFWVFFNQRFHLLHPDQEKYVNEIEKEIYNAALANQVESKGLRYFARLVGQKDPDPYYKSHGICVNTCCEGQGTRLLGSLPEHIYSLAADGLYVNLFAASSIAWSQDGQAMRLTTATRFPYKPEVKLTLSLPRPTKAKIRVRVPTWAARPIPVLVNGTSAGTGQPGTYLTINRKWSDGDTITFTLPMEFKLTRYEGEERDPNHERYALEYGPLLMAVTGGQQEAVLAMHSKQLIAQLRPKAGSPLHFTIAGDERHEYLPYWQVQNEVFTCFPVIGPREGDKR